jgi:cation diffusion facilitator family transporter
LGAVRIEKGEKTALLAVILNLAIFIMKYSSAILSGSIALKAESYHSLADLIASVTVFIGLKIAKRKTKEFPYGLYKLENLLSVFISIIILYTGYTIVLEVIHEPASAITNSWLAIASLTISILVTFFFSGYEKKVAREINSPILLADAAHVRVDVFSNMIVLIAIISSRIGFDLDKIAAIIVILIIAKTGLRILIDGTRVLLDASVGYGTLSKVEKIILGTPQVVELKSLTGRNSGRFKFIEAMIVLKTHNFDNAYLIIEQIEQRARDEIKDIDRVMIQYEPLHKAVTVYALPLTEDLASMSAHFGEAPHFLLLFVNIGEKFASQLSILDNPFCQVERGKGILAAELLVKYGVDVVIVKTDFTSKGPLYVFADADVEIVKTQEETPRDALKGLGLELPAELESTETTKLP